MIIMILVLLLVASILVNGMLFIIIMHEPNKRVIKMWTYTNGIITLTLDNSDTVDIDLKGLKRYIERVEATK